MAQRTRQGRERRRVVAGFAIIALLLAGATVIFLLDRIRMSLQDTYTVIGVFHEIGRVDKGATVWLAGFPVGRVTDVELLPPVRWSGAGYAVHLEIPVENHALVREDSEIRIVRPGFTGRPIVEILPGTPAAPALAPGDTLFADPPIRVRALLDDALAIARSVDSLRADAAIVDSLFQLRTPVLDRLASRLDVAGRELATLSNALEQGPLTAFLNDEEWRASLAQIRETAGEIELAIEARLNTIRDAPLGERLNAFAERARDLQTRVARLEEILATEPLGFTARYRQDPALRDALTAVRAQLDTLVLETRKRPWRFFF